MNRRIFFSLLLIAGMMIGLPVGTAWAGEHYTYDKEHSSIRFTVDNFEIFKIRGAFTEYDGDFVFCLRHPEEDRISIVLYSAGIHAANPERDEELQGPHFFDAAHFPRIEFVSTGMKFTDPNDADVTGNLTLRGVTRPATLHVHFLGKNADFDGSDDDYIVDFSASTVIRRSDFGMDYLSSFIVGDEVQIQIEARGVETDIGTSEGEKQ